MKAFVWSYLFFLALASTGFAAKFPVSAWKDASKQTIPGNAVPNKFIVEVADIGDIPGKREVNARDVGSVLWTRRVIILLMLIAHSHTGRYIMPYASVM